MLSNVAVRFVLSDAYANMSREERQALLHVCQNSSWHQINEVDVNAG